MTEPRSGFAALLGRPNAGKSSLLNRLTGERVAAVSARPQTTWHQIRGIVTDPERGQIVFVDTPGVHDARNAMNRAMLAGALEATLDADVVVLVVDGARLSERDRDLAVWLAAPARLVVAVNKIDGLDEAARAAATSAAAAWPVAAVVPVSAATGEGVAALIDAIFARLPVGPPLYPADEFTDRPLRFLATECIRQALFEQLQQELPYAAFVEIDEWREGSRPLYVRATIHVERDSQKRIVIGSGGAQIRAIGTRARTLIEELTGEQVFLDLWVKVVPKWTRREEQLRRAGLLIEERRLKRVAPLLDVAQRQPTAATEVEA